MPEFPLILKRPLPVIASLARDPRGATAVMLAIALSAIVAFAGLGAEVASWYYTTRVMQTAADTAASSAAAALAVATAAGSAITSSQLSDAGRSVTATFNFTNGVNSTAVSVNNPPATTTNLTTCSAPFSSFNCYVEVVISQPQTPQLASLFMSNGPTIATRAVAFANTGAADTGCVIALDKTASKAIQSSGSGNLTFRSCALYDNSNASDALYVGGSGTIDAQAAYIVGNINGSVTTTDGAHTGMNPTTDPYANAASPSGYSASGTCGYGNGSGESLNKLFPSNGNFNGTSKITTNASSTIINPTSCSIFALGGNQDMHLTNAQTLVLCPGTYVFDTTNLIMDGQSTLLAPPTGATLTSDCPGNTSGGVTIIFSNSTGGSPGIPSIGGGASVTMTAPTTGTYAGIAMFGDRLTCSGNGNNSLNGSGQACNPSLTGGGTQNITGAIYFPKETVNYAGGAAAGGATCTQLIADQISFTGGSTFNSNCSGTGTKTINDTNGLLVM